MTATETRTPAADTDRSPAAKLVDLIEAAESAATGPARRQLVEAVALALQLGESLATSRALVAELRQTRDQRDTRIAELEAKLAAVTAERETAAANAVSLYGQLGKVTAERETSRANYTEVRHALAEAEDVGGKLRALATQRLVERDELQRRLDVANAAAGYIRY